ncbi:MAG: Holliday junction resolvase RuvX [Oscillospiraceae bacterium]|nr:Holliday junction resolvase RuvX [Oscillospiraceae bacterium]
MEAPSSKRMLGVDLGERRTGVALSDPTGTLAGGLELVEADGLNGFGRKIMDLAEKYGVCEIVLGYPVNMNGTLGESAKKTEKFKKMLEELIGKKGLDISVTLFDERLSSALAHVYMNETGIKGKDRKKKVDMLSAQIILQNYIDKKSKK